MGLNNINSTFSKFQLLSLYLRKAVKNLKNKMARMVASVALPALLLSLVSATCVDKNTSCAGWARIGECMKNPAYMLMMCKQSCNNCDGSEGQKPPKGTGGSGGCKDLNMLCAEWAKRGECTKNPGYMLQACKQSCKKMLTGE